MTEAKNLPDFYHVKSYDKVNLMLHLAFGFGFFLLLHDAQVEQFWGE